MVSGTTPSNVLLWQNGSTRAELHFTQNPKNIRNFDNDSRDTD